MAEIAVSFLLEELASYLQNEVQLLSGVPDELENIRDELNSLKAVLRVADTMEDSNEEVKVWLQQVRDVAYDTEDVIDESKLSLANYHGRGHRAFLLYVCCFMMNLKGRHATASRIRGIKSRISNISAKRPKVIDGSTNEQGLGANNGVDRRGDALLLDRIDLVGIDQPKRQLIKWLVNGNIARKVVSVVGMGGSGKTTLVKQVYDDPYVKKHFTAHAWITVPHPFKTEDLLRNLLGHLFNATPEGLGHTDGVWLKLIVKSLLEQQRMRYLIVLDDVWDINEWEALSFVFANNGRGSRVVLTTRNADVAKTACVEPEDVVFDLEPLSPEESWTLFCKKCFRQSGCPPELEHYSRRILERCEGLPLAIVAISGVLAAKRHSIVEWESIYRSLGDEIDNNKKLMNLREVLLLSFNDLPYHLKFCFLYLSIFPENHLIESMRLIRLWIAEGFVEAKEGKTKEKVAEDYLNELLNRNLVQVAGTTIDGRVKTCRIHDLLREIIISKAKDQNFIAIAKGPDTMWAEKVRRLSIRNTLQNVQRNKNVSHLRSLFMFELEDSPSSSPIRTVFPNGLKLLKVLDSRAAPLKAFPEEIVDLKLLRYLSLRGTEVKTIPSSIGKLQYLETLDLKHSQVTELPVQVVNLRRLRHLLVYRYEFRYYSRFHSKYGFKALVGISALQSLQKLCFLDVDQDNGSLREVGKLTQLRRLGITNLRRKDGITMCSTIERLANLHALSIVSSVKDEVIDLQHLRSPPQLLQRIYLSGRLQKLPEWIPSLQGLVVLYLKWSRLEYDPLSDLQHLPNLAHLELLQVFLGDTLSFQAGGFQKLKVLGIDKFDDLKCIQVGKGSMPCIEKLSILRCKSLEMLPVGIEYLTTLKVLEFFEMPEELIRSLRLNANGGVITHIPEVYYTYCRNGSWEVYSVHDSGERPLSEHETYIEGIVKK